MNDKELMEQAKYAILSLREELRYKDARLNMFDDVMMMLNTSPRHGVSNMMGVSTDIVARLNQRIDEHESKEDKS